MMNINSYMVWHWNAIIRESTKTEDFMLLILSYIQCSGKGQYGEGYIIRRA